MTHPNVRELPPLITHTHLRGIAVSYHEKINAHSADPRRLEEIYHEALDGGEADAFQRAIETGHTVAPDNLLYAAWYHRLQHTAARAKSFAIAWAWVIPLALVNALIFWFLSDEQRFVVEIIRSPRGDTVPSIPFVLLLAAPISAAVILAYFTAVSRKRWPIAALIAALALAAGAYVLYAYPLTGTRPFQEQYVTLMAMHLPLLSWAAVGGFLIFEHRDPANRFAFLIKSLELFIMGGLFVIAGGVFTGITIGLFEALNVDLPELVMRLFIAGGGGLIPVIAAAIIYNPNVPPAAQSFDEGLSKLIALLMRFMLPLTLLVLLVYIAFIPFNFREPFQNRDVLIIYNAMLFAVIALLVGATPVNLQNISPPVAVWLRRGIIAVAALALLVSLYALAAIVYRTTIDRLTPNRLAFIGWNLINISLLFLLLLYQFRARAANWLPALYRAYSAGTVAYTVWALLMILALPWLFGIDQAELENLPAVVQDIVYEHPEPILLKCGASPHIYLLEDGEKRWIDSIETFDDRGYLWREVRPIPCRHLREIPDGAPIPADAGPPPQP